MERLKAALMGLTDTGWNYLSAAVDDPRIDLVAVADTDPKRLRTRTDAGSVRVYDDCRSLIVETARLGFDVLLVALEPFESIEFVELAADRGVAVFHKPPPARSTRELGHLIERFDAHGCPLIVSRRWQSEPAFAPLLGLTEIANRIHAATADVQTTEIPQGWRGNAAQAGGGVLLNGAYVAIDVLTCVLGLPETVYARCASAAPSTGTRSYDTEDAAVVSLSFGHDRIASVTARRGARESTWRVTFVTDDRTVETGPDSVTVTPHSGMGIERTTVQTPNSAAPGIGAFATAQLSEDKKFQSTAKDHLATLAVIEAAYLSAKTGQPESPARLLS